MDTPIPIREGSRVPAATFKRLTSGALQQVTTDELFGNKVVVLFGLPGAFTPTCSSRQVPRYDELASELKKRGVDDIICLAVNDPWVMAAWAKEEGAAQINFIPDADASFTRQMGMLMDKNDAALGQRSRRYSMLVKNGVIEKMFVEPNTAGDPFTVSDADNMLRYLDPDADALTPVTMFAREGCPFCARAEALLNERGMAYEIIHIGDGITMQSVLAATGASTVPQVFIGGRLIGGSDALQRYLNERDRSDDASNDSDEDAGAGRNGEVRIEHEQKRFSRRRS